jgi:hypothetical protein
MKQVLAVDQSLTSSGVAWWSVGEAPAPITGNRLPIWRTCKTLKPPAKIGKGPGRLQWIRERLIEEIGDGVDLIVLEGRAPKGINDALSLGGLYAILEVTAHERGIEVLIVPPASRVSWMSRGKLSTKMGTDALKREAVTRAIAELDAAEDINDDEADASWLAEIGAHYLGLTDETDPKRVEIITALRKTPEDRKRAEEDALLKKAGKIAAARKKAA